MRVVFKNKNTVNFYGTMYFGAKKQYNETVL